MNTPDSERPRLRPGLLIGALLVLTALATISRLLTLPPGAESYDGSRFVAGVERFSLAEQRPHWPGYPVYVGLGKLLCLVLGHPVAALRTISVASSVLALWPLALLAASARRAGGASERDAVLAGLAAAMVFLLTPAGWLTGSEILSDPLGLLLALVVLLISWRLLSRSGGASLVGAGVLAGLLPGVRLADAPLSLPLVYAVFRPSRSDPPLTPGRGLPFGPRLALVVAAVIGAALWLGGVWLHEGNVLAETTLEHLAGHYGQWGNSANQDPAPWTRPLRLVRVLVVSGLGGWWPGLPWSRLPATIGLGVLVLRGLRRLSATATPLRPLLLAWTVPYALWVLLGFNLDVPRYALPLVAAIALVAGFGVPGRGGGAVIVALAAAQTAVTLPLAIEHARRPSLGYALAEALGAHASGLRPALLVTDPRLFVPEAALPAGSTLRHVDPAALSAEQRRLAAQGLVVYATAPAPDAPGEWEPVGRLRRTLAMSPPGPSEVWVFRRTPP